MDRIGYFNWVRDIPYRVPLSPTEPDYCCFGKAQMLEKLLKTTGLDVRPRICDFNWTDLKLPEDILKIPHEDHLGGLTLYLQG